MSICPHDEEALRVSLGIISGRLRASDLSVGNVCSLRYDSHRYWDGIRDDDLKETAEDIITECIINGVNRR